MMVTNRTGRLLVVAVLFLTAAQSARAHDIWLKADSYSLAEGESLVIRQLVGAELETDLSRAEGTQELGVLRDMTPGFSLITDKGTVDLLAELPDIRTQADVRPVLNRQPDFHGMALVTMEHGILYTAFTREEFLEYLEHEDLKPEGYPEHMGTAEFQEEGYQRTLKALVLVGEETESLKDSDLHGRVVGQRIEIVLRQNPYLLDPGDELEVQVLLHGEPLAGQVVKAYNDAGEGTITKQQVMTAADGTATFALDRSGLWLVRLVHLTPCSERSGVDCEDTAWASYWTAYSFAVD